MPSLNSGALRLSRAFLASLLVVGLGALDDWYGRFDYAADAISYLDVSKAIQDGDWTLAFSPYWSVGYPAILAAVRWMFPAGPQGEWTAIHALNLAIFIATYLSFLHLLRVTLATHSRVDGVETAASNPALVYILGTAFFLLLQLMIGNVARVNPDLLVSGVFFLATAESLRFLFQPRIGTALVLGLLMGFGYILKAVFLPLSVMLLLVVLVRISSRWRVGRTAMISKLAWALPAMAVLAAPYIVAISIAAGFFTLGETGSLNYAWNVNHLPFYTHWQGGPAPLGTPVHPTQLLLRNPHVFAFAEPFHVTYPPWFNPCYWYTGYHHVFSFRNQLEAVKGNLVLLRHFVLRGPRAIGTTLLVSLSLIFLRERKVWWKRVLTLWPLYLPSILAIVFYLGVVVEPRYLVGFLIIVLTTPFVALFAPTRLVSRGTAFVIVLLVSLGCAAVLMENEQEALRRFVHHENYLDDDQWRTGLYLSQIGVHAGDKVASVVAVGGGMHCTWAEVSGTQVVAEIGENSFAPADEDKDFRSFTQDPAAQQTVLELFRQAGAKIVVVIGAGQPIQGVGWERVPGTAMWFHRL
jgi:hypothetical protein